MKLLVGSAIKDRHAITDCFMRHLRALDTAYLDISWFWIICQESDRWADLYKVERLIDLPGMNSLILCDSGPFYSRDIVNKNGDEHRLQAFRRMAFLRNLLRERALYEGVDALVSIDSDICPPPDLLQRLVAADKPWVAALVDNSAMMNKERDPELWRMKGETPQQGYMPLFNVMNLEETEDPEARFITRHFAPELTNGGECDATGAVCLYSRELLQASRWESHMAGEDIGFSLNAKRAGFKAHYIPLLCDHLMNEQRLEAHLQNCDTCLEKRRIDAE